MKAREIMRRNPTVVTPTEQIYRAAELMHYERDACIPVVTDRVHPTLVGVITARDIAVRCVARRHTQDCLVSDHMTPQPLQTLLPDDGVAEAVRKMTAAEVRRIPVVTADGVLLGIVIEEDIGNARRDQEMRKDRAAPRDGVTTTLTSRIAADVLGVR